MNNIVDIRVYSTVRYNLLENYVKYIQFNISLTFSLNLQDKYLKVRFNR